MKTFITYFIGVTTVLGFVSYATTKTTPVFDQEISNLSAKVTESRNTLATLQSARILLNGVEEQTTRINLETPTEVPYSSPKNIIEISTEEESIPNVTPVLKYEDKDSGKGSLQELSHYSDEDSDEDDEDDEDDD